ncbi:SDR family NAD(P)-dependent oxidoreductase [Paeniroseomonas aquatica]|uniref:SDR family NAD(P)-dependent oxidoreductase n=1 Tax=Paeniroseomonas aquatica TaxID=373043 RepID=UPI003620C1E6
MSKALIIGAGDGLSAALARRLAREGYAVALAARDIAKLAALAAETGASRHATDAADPAAMAALFAAEGDAEVVVYNPSYRTRGPIAGLDPAEVQKSLQVCAFGAFLAVQQAARRMLAAGRGTILLTGASAGVKGFPLSAPFAMGKSRCAAWRNPRRGSCTRRACMSRMSSSTAASAAPGGRTAATRACSTRMRSPRATCS